MNGHLTPSQIHELVAHAVEPEELLEIDRHLESCEQCRDRWSASHELVLPQLAPRQEPIHLSYEELRSQAQGSPAPRAKEHLRECAPCRTEVEELHRFAAMLREPGARTAWTARLAPWFAIPPIWKAAVACAMLVLAIVWIGQMDGVATRLSAGERITDAGHSLLIDPRGEVRGWDELPDNYRRAIQGAIASGEKTPAIDLEQARVRFASSHLVMAVACWQAGMIPEATAELAQLKQRNPRSRILDRLTGLMKR